MDINTENKTISAVKLYSQGLLAERAGDLETAEKFYRSSMDIDPGFAKSYQNLGSIYSRKGNKKEALQIFEKAVAIQPGVETFYNLAVEQYKSEKTNDAIRNLKKSLSYDKRFIKSHLLLAHAYEKTGAKEKTEVYLKNSLKIDPANKTALSAAILFYYDSPHPENALPYIDKYLSVAPGDTRFTLLKSEVLTRSGNFGKSFEVLEEAVTSGKEFVRFNDAVAESNAAEEGREFQEELKSRTSQKIKEFRARLELSKENPEDFTPPEPADALDLSLMYLFSGDPKTAMKYLTYARKISGQEADASNL